MFTWGLLGFYPSSTVSAHQMALLKSPSAPMALITVKAEMHPQCIILRTVTELNPRMCGSGVGGGRVHVRAVWQVTGMTATVIEGNLSVSLLLCLSVSLQCALYLHVCHVCGMPEEDIG